MTYGTKQISLQELTDKWFDLIRNKVSPEKVPQIQEIINKCDPFTGIFLFSNGVDNTVSQWILDTFDESEYVIIDYHILVINYPYIFNEKPRDRFFITNAIAFIKNPQAALQFKLMWT